MVDANPWFTYTSRSSIVTQSSATLTLASIPFEFATSYEARQVSPDLRPGGRTGGRPGSQQVTES